MMKIRRIIEKVIILALIMEMPKFPCFRVDVSNCKDDLIDQFLEKRPSQNWLLLAEYAAQSEQQLWTAWLLSQRSFIRNRALARSIDAEFLRYMAGTHHVSEAFKKAGISLTQKMAWIIHLPDYEIKEDEIYPKVDLEKSSQTLNTLVDDLGMSHADGKPEITLEGLLKLGIDVATIDDKTEDIIIGFTISSDLNS